ncbi:MAG TPA: ribosome biogenesis factor YjgA [Rhodocyclaceae bacterium]|nr:ribosome biogenesis factor YjgA [Rhodocyclaceae bacterium]
MIPVHTDDEAQLPHDERPSKSQAKRDMDALQALGARLVAISAERLAKIDMPDDLRDAVRDAQRFTKHEARRRQLQYIGRLMRGLDPAPIQAAIDEIDGVSAAANARQHALERLRERLLEDESALDEIARRTTGADFQRLRQLRRNALKERAEQKPPRAYRELFRVLRELEEQSGDNVDD